jgi:hypothetical protein
VRPRFEIRELAMAAVDYMGLWVLVALIGAAWFIFRG